MDPESFPEISIHICTYLALFAICSISKPVRKVYLFQKLPFKSIENKELAPFHAFG